MTRTTVRVVLVLVALSSDSATRPPELVGYRPDGSWLCRALPLSGADTDPRSVAFELLERCGPRITREIPADRRPALEPVAFVEQPRGTVDLVYTAPVPLTAVMVDEQLLPVPEAHPQPPWESLAPELPPFPAGAGTAAGAARWARTVTKAVNAADPIGYAVLDHWRQLVEETTAATELLPRYFTITQLRTVYDAIWGDPQDPGNFHSWATRSNSGTYSPADPIHIGRDLDTAAHAHLTHSDNDHISGDAARPTIRAVTQQLAGPGLVGTSPLALGRAVAALGGLGAASALAGGLIAHQATRTPGKKATWYQQVGTTRTILKVVYSPRPAWRAAGIDAAAGRRYGISRP